MNAPPRILIVSHGLHLGGVERSLLGLLRALPPGAAAVDLLLHDRRGPLLAQVPPGIRVLPQKPAHKALIGSLRKALLSPHWPIGLARLWARAVIALRRGCGLSPGFLLARAHRYAAPLLPRPDASYDLAISFLTPHDFVARRVEARRKVGWIHTDYTSVETGVAVGFERQAWERMDAIIAVSPEVGVAFAKVFPDLAPRVAVIENILDPAWIRQQADDASEGVPAAGSDVLTLCTVGRFSHAKGIDLAVEAARLLKERGLRFRWYVVGFGPDEAMIRGKVAELGVSGEFVLLGPRANPYPWMRACDIYVQPSRYEGKAVSIREAQILGRPVVVSEFPTVRSQVEHGVDGYVAPAGIVPLADAIQRVASDPGLRDRLIESTRRRDYGNLAEAAKVLALLP